MNRHLALLVLIAALAFAISPFFVQNFGGYRPDAFPIPQDDPPIQPAGWAFAIWGLIYLWLIAGSAYGFLRAREDADWQPMRMPLLISLAIGVVWLPVALRSPVLATVLILAMLVFALIAFLRAGTGDPWWQVRPVAVYAGWLTAASGASLGIVLGGYGILSGQVAAILCLILVLLIALAVQARRPAEWGYPAAIVWALAAILAANLAPLNLMIALLAGFGALLMVARAIMGATRS